MQKATINWWQQEQYSHSMQNNVDFVAKAASNNLSPTKLSNF